MGTDTEVAQQNSADGGAKDGAAPKAGGGNSFTKKMIKIVTVMAYVSGISGAGFLLSLYYIILWDPNIQGVKPPGYLKSGERVGLPQARTAPMPEALKAKAPAAYDKKMSNEYMEEYFRNITANTGETRMAGDGSVMDSQPTPRVLPLIPETNYNNGHQAHHHGHTTQSNNNYQSSGSLPQQGVPSDTSPTGSPFVSEDIRKQQEHGQPPLSSTA